MQLYLVRGRAGCTYFNLGGGELYIGQFFVFSGGKFSRVSFHTRTNSGGAAAPPRTPVQPGLLERIYYDAHLMQLRVEIPSNFFSWKAGEMSKSK